MERWVQVPIGEKPTRYLTVPFSKTILVVARTEMTTGWLLDFLPEIVSDTRIQLLFTVEDESPSVYHRGALELLHDMQVPVIPWAQARANRFDLAVCSTHTGSLEHLRSRLFITPHGPGFGKPASIRPGGLIPLPCDDDGELAASGLPLTTAIVSHPEQRALFAGGADNVELVVAGDPVYDRLQASRIRRPEYRSAFGVDGARKLIIISSTWGPRSQLATEPDLSERLLRALPIDEYQLGMIIHPNIWHGHSTWQVRTWLRRAAEAGAILIPPRDGWRAAIIAADIVLVDHGSVGFYAAAIGTPVAAAAFDLAELMPDSPLAELGRQMSRIDLAGPLRQQIENAITGFDPDRISTIVDRMFAEKGRSLDILRAAIYRLIGLEPTPGRPRTMLIDAPVVQRHRVTAHVVHATVRRPGTGPAEVTVTRRAASIPPGVEDGGFGNGPSPLRYLVVSGQERDPGMLQDASVIVCASAIAEPILAASWGDRTLKTFPGCRFAVTTHPDGTVAAHRRRRPPIIATEVPGGCGAPSIRPIDPTIVAAAIYALDVTSGRADRHPVDAIVRLGAIAHRLRLHSA